MQEGLDPLTLAPKETLAVINGTAVMGALACLAFGRARRLADLAAFETALACYALRGQPAHFHDRIFELKPHPGQRAVAARIRAALDGVTIEPLRVQDPYSLRCAPHVIGVLSDALPFVRGLIETEVNGVNDNPLFDG